MFASRSRRFIGVFASFCALVGIFALHPDAFPYGAILMQRITGKATISDRLAEFGPAVDARWRPFFESAHVSYPPSKLLFVGFKREKRLEIYASNESDAGNASDWKFIRAMPILGASGKMGPKLKEGDLQVPEGFYKIESLNPNSSFHLALRVSYPSPFDREMAARENRTDLGGDIMIHGDKASVGCVAMGDEGAEDLFILAAKTGIENIDLWLCPLDFRHAKIPDGATSRHDWLHSLYGNLETSVRSLPSSHSLPPVPNSPPY